MSCDIGKLDRVQIGERFFSRKNTVFRSMLDGRPVVVKAYMKDASALASKEYTMLESCRDKGVSVPNPIGLKESVIVMEWIYGPTVAEYLDSAWLGGEYDASSNQADLDAKASSLGSWLATFHASFDFRACRGDANIRNFIIGAGGVVGIDFEESGGSEVMDDLGQICSSILSMHPMFTADKIAFCNRLAEAYFSITGDAKAAELNEAIARGLEFYASHRSDGEMMVRKADEIRKAGFWSSEER